MLSPSERWSWYHCTRRHQLVLDMNTELAFSVPFASHLLHLPCMAEAFTMQDAELYWRLFESLSDAGLSRDMQLYFTLTGLAAIKFMRPQGHKSWYVADIANSKTLYEHHRAELVGQQVGHVLILQSDNGCSECLLLDDIVSLTGKKLVAGTVLRLLNSRLRPALHSMQYKSA